MKLIAFQEVTPAAESGTDLFQRAREGIEGELVNAAEESASFIVDLGAALISLAWTAAIIVLVFWLGRHVRRWFRARVAARWPEKPNRVSLIDQILQIAFVMVAVFYSLRIVGISSNSVVTSIGIILGALSIALQDVLKNLVAGVYLLVEQPFEHGDRLTIPGADGGQDGWVEHVSMRATELRNVQRELVLVPNYVLFSEIVVNRTAEEPYSLNIRLSLIDTPAPRVESDIQHTLSSILGAGFTAPAVHLLGAGPLGAAADIRVWFDPDQDARRAVIVALNERFPEAFLEVVSG